MIAALLAVAMVVVGACVTVIVVGALVWATSWALTQDRFTPSPPRGEFDPGLRAGRERITRTYDELRRHK